MVGLIVATIAAIVAFIMCKRRRRRRIRLSISRPLPYPDNPFEDPRESPSPTQMRYNPDTPHRNVVGTGLGAERMEQRNLLDAEFDNIATPVMSHASGGRHSRTGSTELTLAGVGAGNKSVGRPAYDAPTPTYTGPFSEYHTFQPGHQQRPSDGSGSIGVAITNDTVQQHSEPTPRHVKRVSNAPSATPSTPSIYPATLPGGEEDMMSESSHTPLTPSTIEPSIPPLDKPVRPPRKRPVAPLPPRNPQRNPDLQTKLLVRTQVTPEDAKVLEPQPYEPLTPPASVSSDSGYSPVRTSTNPFLDYNRYMSEVQAPIEAKPRDTFYTRRKLVNTHVRAPSPSEIEKRFRLTSSLAGEA